MANRKRNPAEEWRDAYSLKQNYERCAVLERMRRLPHQAIFKLAGIDRRFVSRSRKIPKRLDYKEYVFARSARKGVMKDVVLVGIKRGTSRLHIERIILCTEMRVACTPRYYWYRQLIHAQAGYSPAIHVDEYLSGFTEPRFAEDIERSLPRLKGYKYRGLWVTCDWSAKEFGLNDWKRRLKIRSLPELATALIEFLDRYRFRKRSRKVDREIQEALTPLLVKCLWIPKPSIGSLVLQILQEFSEGHPEQAARHLLPLSVASDKQTRLHLIKLLKNLVPEDRAYTSIVVRLLAEIAESDPDKAVSHAAAGKLAAFREGG